MLKIYMKFKKFKKKRQKLFRFQFCEARRCPFECPMPKTQTPVILRLFKRAGDREPVLPEALPKPQVEADADVRKLLGLSCLLRD